jgi:hypothetical protein
MCKAGSLGDVSCEALPYGQDSGGRCDAENIEQVLGEDDENRPHDGAQQAAPAAAVDLQSNNQQQARVDLQSSNQQQARVDGSSDQCKKGIRDQIDTIDAQMREGYDSAQGQRYRESLRALTTRLHNC